MEYYFEDLEDPRLLAMKDRLSAPNNSLFVMVAGESIEHVKGLLSHFEHSSCTLFGGVFHQVMFGPKLYRRGCVVSEFSCTHRPQLFTRLDDANLPDVSHLPTVEELLPGTTVMLFVDVSARAVCEFVTSIYSRYGNRVKYIGGGAGPVDTRGGNIPNVFSSVEPMKKNAAVVAFTNRNACIASGHGWERVFGPLIATRVEGDVLLELNWRPAFDVYREVIEGELQQKLSEESYKVLDTVGFPFGIIKEGVEDLVRLPISVTPEGGLICIGGIQTDCVLHVLRGDPEVLVSAAQETAGRCVHAFESATQKIVIDCISRYLFLEEGYQSELDIVSESLLELSDAPMVGALSEGEIASSDISYLDMLNKTIVIGVFEDDQAQS